MPFPVMLFTAFHRELGIVVPTDHMVLVNTRNTRRNSQSLLLALLLPGSAPCSANWV